MIQCFAFLVETSCAQMSVCVQSPKRNQSENKRPAAMPQGVYFGWEM